jgi:cytochrome c2
MSIKAFAVAAAQDAGDATEDHWMRMRFGPGTIVMALMAAVVLAPPVARAADPGAGKDVFRQRCAICHSDATGVNKIGPSLFGVVGRKAGSIPGYHYSDANEKSDLTWDVATLDRYLQHPRDVVPGTKMSFPGLPDATARADVIAYLATLH